MKLFKTLGASLLLCLCSLGFAQAATPSFVTLKDSAGDPVRAYVAGPEEAKAGILIVHDYFGISDFTLSAAEHLATLGYRVVAIDLYSGRSATTDAEAVKLMQAMQAQDRAITDRTLGAGLNALKANGRKIGTLGFSMGGIEALNVNLNDKEAVQATAIIYGFGFGQLGAGNLASLKSPLLTITGALDEGSIQASAELMQRRGALAQTLQMLVVPAVGHAYAQPLFEGGKGYSAPATAATWAAIDRFFMTTLQ